MNNSLLKESVWRWRYGRKKLPLHSASSPSYIAKLELYTLVQNNAEAQSVIEELRDNGIVTETKQTHSPYDSIPKGSQIVFASTSEISPTKSEKENIEKLKSYILANGGTVYETPQKKSVLGNFMQNLFGRR